MRKIVFIILVLLGKQANAQSYHWDFAINTGTCSNIPRTYPFTYNDIGSGVLKPLAIDFDNFGNTYVMGNFPIQYFDAKYKIGNKDSVEAFTLSTNTYLYIYKINTQDEIEWSVSVGTDGIDLGSLNHKVDLAVNPYSGKFYLTMNSLSYFYLNKIDINTRINPTVIPKMMLCFNEDASFSKLLGGYYMEKPIFSSSSSGIFKASAISEYNPGNYDISFFNFDAQKDTITNSKLANSVRILYFDSKKQRFISDLLAEFDVNLNKVVNEGNFSQLGSIFSQFEISDYKRDKNGNHYYFFYNINRNPIYEELFYVLKLDKNLNRKWVHYSRDNVAFDIDSNGNPWLKVLPKTLYIIDNSLGKIYPNQTENPSNVYLIKLDSATGNITNTKIIPTNLIEQTNDIGLFKIDNKNRFWISGFLYNEAEFGNFKLKMDCYYLPIQHYVARAKEGWKQDRKNLSTKDYINYGNLNFYPNPVNSQLKIADYRLSDFESVEVYNSLGVKQTLSINYHLNEIDVSGLINGIYILKITTNNTTHLYKIIKQ